MKATKFFTAIALAATLMFSACNKTESENPDDPDNTDPNQTEEVEGTPIVFTATLEGGWEGVSSVAVMIDGTVKEYGVTVSDADNTSATLSSDDPHYWTDSNEITVAAWWPYTEDETTMPEVVVNADQSTADGFEGSDFISAEDQAVQSDDPTLIFTHRTARVTVILTDNTDGLKSVKLKNLYTDNGNPAEIAPYEYDKENFTYVAFVAPQTVAQGTAFITCEFDDAETFDYEMQDATEWKAGEEYTYTVSLPEAETDPGYTYTVYNADDLLAWNEAVQDDLSLNCTLADNIDLTGIDYEWLLVGNEGNQYTGTFEGGGHTITGLTVNKSGTGEVGLIGFLGSDGKVQNLTLDNVSITGSYAVGSVVGYNYGTVTDCSVSGSVSGSSAVGGVVGNNSGTVTACYASGSVSGGSYVGGVVGSNNLSISTVTACYHTSGSISGSDRVGGVLGENDRGTVIACYHAAGSVSGSGTYVGGVVGYNNSGTMTACYWSDYNGNGFGDNNNGTVEATEVDGSTTTWSDAVTGMNAAIETWNSNNPDEQCDWRYVLTGELPTLTK